MMFGSIERDWVGETVIILGGGPSLKLCNIEKIRGLYKTIAINDAFKIAPWADLLYFADLKWYEWNEKDVVAFKNKIYTRCSIDKPYIVRLKWNSAYKLSAECGVVAGWCSGANAINIAYLKGASKIILIGFDMKGNGNWHNNHKRPQDATMFSTRFIPSLEAMAVNLRANNIEVINTCMDSGLECFTKIAFEDIINA